MRSLSQLPSRLLSECRHELKTGDIVLFSGRSVAARVVQFFTGSPWSHVGIIICSEELPGQPLLWEATRLSKVRDVRCGQPADGVQLVSLQERLASYDGVVAFRRLAQPPTPDKLAGVSEWMASWHGKPYRNYVGQWLRGLLQSQGLGFQAGGFCSELVAEVYRRWQILPMQRPSHHYVPRDFCDRRGIAGLHQQLSPACRISL